MSKNALKFLKEKEWSMGNGQCPECCGVPASWYGHPCYMTPETIGHEKNCALAKALKDLGDNPLIKGQYKSNDEYEHFISDQGFLVTRKKTPEGCQRYRDHIEKKS